MLKVTLWLNIVNYCCWSLVMSFLTCYHLILFSLFTVNWIYATPTPAKTFDDIRILQSIIVMSESFKSHWYLISRYIFKILRYEGTWSVCDIGVYHCWRLQGDLKSLTSRSCRPLIKVVAYKNIQHHNILSNLLSDQWTWGTCQCSYILWPVHVHIAYVIFPSVFW